MNFRAATLDDLAKLAAARWAFRTEDDGEVPIEGEQAFALRYQDFVRDALQSRHWTYWIAETADGELASHMAVCVVRSIPRPLPRERSVGLPDRLLYASAVSERRGWSRTSFMRYRVGVVARPRDARGMAERRVPTLLRACGLRRGCRRPGASIARLRCAAGSSTGYMSTSSLTYGCRSRRFKECSFRSL